MRVVRIALILFGVASAFSIAAEVSGEVSHTDLFGLSLKDLAEALNFIVSLGCYILVGMRIYRAHANLRDAGVEGLEYSPGWAVGWYFVPIASLFKPYQAMRELRKESLVGAALDNGGQSDLGFWWAAWIAGSLIAGIFARPIFFGETLSVGADALSTIITAIAAWFLWRIISQITAAQESVLTIAHVFE